MSLIAHYERVCVHMSEEWSCSHVCLWECDDYEAHRDVPCVFAQLEQLQTELTADRESLRSAESLSADLLKEKAQLEKTLETLQENSDRQVNFIHVDRKTCYTADLCRIDNVIHFITTFSCPPDKIIDFYTVKTKCVWYHNCQMGELL